MFPSLKLNQFSLCKRLLMRKTRIDHHRILKESLQKIDSPSVSPSNFSYKLKSPLLPGLLERIPKIAYGGDSLTHLRQKSMTKSQPLLLKNLSKNGVTKLRKKSANRRPIIEKNKLFLKAQEDSGKSQFPEEIKTQRQLDFDFKRERASSETSPRHKTFCKKPEPPFLNLIPKPNYGNYIVKVFDGNMKQTFSEETHKSLSTEDSDTAQIFLGLNRFTPRTPSHFKNSSPERKQIRKFSSKRSHHTSCCSTPKSILSTKSIKHKSSRDLQESPDTFLRKIIQNAECNVKTCSTNQADFRIALRMNLFKQTIKEPNICSTPLLPTIVLPPEGGPGSGPGLVSGSGNQKLSRSLTRNSKQIPTTPLQPVKIQLSPPSSSNKFSLPPSPIQGERPSFKRMSTQGPNIPGSTCLRPWTRAATKKAGGSPDLLVNSQNENSPQRDDDELPHTFSVKELIKMNNEKRESIAELLLKFKSDEVESKEISVRRSIQKQKIKRLKTIECKDKIEKKPTQEFKMLKIDKIDSERRGSNFRSFSSFKFTERGIV